MDQQQPEYCEQCGESFETNQKFLNHTKRCKKEIHKQAQASILENKQEKGHRKKKGKKKAGNNKCFPFL